MSNHHHPATVVFDLDGTLAETAPDIIATLNVILNQEGLATVPVEKARDLVGAGARALLQRGFSLHGKALSADILETLFQQFLVIYAEKIADESTLFPGVQLALERLLSLGHQLAVCTNKPEYHSRLLLDALGISGKFKAICGRDTFPVCKPDPQHLILTIAQAGGDVKHAIMVGDSKTDVDTARAAGIPVIAVPFGYTPIPVAELEPDVIIQHFDELESAVIALLESAQS